ncbi:MAG: hypothetical protein AAGF07_00285 [Patescibacteria group bacterium]
MENKNKKLVLRKEKPLRRSKFHDVIISYLAKEMANLNIHSKGGATANKTSVEDIKLISDFKPSLDLLDTLKRLKDTSS